jgi:hypothetical protein
VILAVATPGIAVAVAAAGRRSAAAPAAAAQVAKIREVTGRSALVGPAGRAAPQSLAYGALPAEAAGVAITAEAAVERVAISTITIMAEAAVAVDHRSLSQAQPSSARGQDGRKRQATGSSCLAGSEAPMVPTCSVLLL